MCRKTINTREVIKLFKSILEGNTRTRVLFLRGATKMGKTHLLSNEFRVLAEERQAKCVSIDLKSSTLTCLNILYSICIQLGEEHCTSYELIRREMERRSDTIPVLNRVFAFFSRINISVSERAAANDFQQRCQYLTTELVKDVRKFGDRNQLVVFLIDNVHGAGGFMKVWLMNMFLRELAHLPNVTIVLAGRSLPEADIGYAAFCEPPSHLSAIRDIDAYVVYCQQNNIGFLRGEVELLAALSDYIPGFFMENLEKVTRAGLVRELHDE